MEPVQWEYPSVRVLAGAEVIYRASALGSCTKALAAARQELEAYTGPAPKNLQKAFDKGHASEPVAYKWLEEHGWTLYGQQSEVTVKLTPRLHIIGHPDTMGDRRDGSPVKVIDVKRNNDAEFAKESIRDTMFWPKYAWQFSAYMVATGLGLVVVRVSDQGEVKTEEIDDPPYGRGDLLQRLLQVERLAHETLANVACDKNDYPCPYFKLFPHGKQGDEPEEHTVDDAELATWIVHLERVRGDKNELDKIEKGLRAKIVERVEEGITKDSSTGVAVKKQTIPTGQRITPPGKMVRLTPILPAVESDEQGEQQNGDTDAVHG